MNYKKEAIGVVLVLLSLGFLIVPVAAAQVTVSIDSVSADSGNTVVVSIVAHQVTDLGAFGLQLRYDPTVVMAMSTENNPQLPDSFGATDWSQNATGLVGIASSGMTLPSLSGDVVLTNVTLKAVGSAWQTSALNITIGTLYESDGATEIPATDVDGTFTISTGPPAPTIVSYTISNSTINPLESETTSIDVEFSETVNYRIAIEKDSTTIYDWTGTAENPNAKVWDGTYESNSTRVPDGVYTVNVTGTNTTTGLSVIDTSKTITVSTVGELTTITVSPSTAYVKPGGTKQFVATAKDQYGNLMSDVVITWTSSNTTVGDISPGTATTGADGKATTTFTATATLGTTTIKAANGTVNGTASVTVANVRSVKLDYNANNTGYNYIAWSGGDATASTLAGLIKSANETAFGDNEWIAKYNTPSGTWVFYFGNGTGTNFALAQYDSVCVRVKAEVTFQMPI